VHNRLCAVPADLNNDGYEDLILGAATYQLGIKTDPNPGGGLYYLINKGIGADGLPLLAEVMKLPIEGWEPKIGLNSMINMQTLDIDNDGEKEVIIGIREEKYLNRVFKVKKDEIGLQYTGFKVPGMRHIEHLLDIDGDGMAEIVFAGGEPGIGYYIKCSCC